MSKVIAIIDRPKSCDECIFARCKYSLPLSTNRRGYYCQLKEPQERVVEDFACDEEMHLSNCPLKELPQKQTIHCTDTTHHRFAKDGWNACINEIIRGSEENG